MMSEQVAAHWNQVTKAPSTGVTRWWQSKIIVAHINEIVCGKSLPGAHAGFHELLRKEAGGRRFRRAVSIGCGEGSKERSLLSMGLVDSFDLYELSSARVERGMAAAQKAGLAQRMQFHLADAFAEVRPAEFDLVYWNNALHHMMDVDEAVRWSKSALREGGVFAMDDYTGESRFQWSDGALAAATRVRELLPPRLLAHPQHTHQLLGTRVARPDAARLAEVDPSEAADSSRILSAIGHHFPNAKVILAGGCVYHLALKDAIGNFGEADEPLLRSLLLLDDALAHLGHNLYSVAVGQV